MKLRTKIYERNIGFTVLNLSFKCVLFYTNIPNGIVNNPDRNIQNDTIILIQGINRLTFTTFVDESDYR